MKSKILIFILSLALFCAVASGLVFSFVTSQEISYHASAVEPVISQLAQPTTAAVPLTETAVEPENKLNLAVFSSTNDPYLEKQWALGMMPLIPDKYKQTEAIVVAVLDTGIDTRHEDLSTQISNSIIFSDSSTYADLNGHGTHVAGIIAASADNGLGITGAAPHVKLLNVKVAEDNGMVWESNVARGIHWAVDNGASIINMSLTAPSSSAALEDAVRYALNQGVVLVAAAGNSGVGETYPAAIPGVIAVAALNPDNTLWAESNDASFVDAYAPGVDIYSTLPKNQYGYYSGTSMAAAYVSAISALALDNIMDRDADGFFNDDIAQLIEEFFPRP